MSCVQPPDGWVQPVYPKIPGAIFVSIASYRDDECKDTIAQLYQKAKNPDSVFVGVCQQNKLPGEDCFDRCRTCAFRKRAGQIRVINMPHFEARGPTFARYHCSKLWRGEELYMQIDSHTNFEQDWDLVVWEQRRATGDPMAVIGAYPPSGEQMDKIKRGIASYAVTSFLGPFDRTGTPALHTHLIEVEKTAKPILVYAVPGNLVVFPGEALYKVPFDPFISFLFFGEELLYSVRLWTNGYNLYAPSKPWCSHHYGRQGKPRFNKDIAVAETCKRRAEKRCQFILGLCPLSDVPEEYRVEVSRYGLGRARSLAQYYAEAGVDPARRVVKKLVRYK